MGLGVVTNLVAMSTLRHSGAAAGAMQTSLERLSSGLRINRAADDAAGLAISEGLRAQSRGMTQAVRNTRDAISVVQTAEGALGASTSILQRMRDLTVQAANDGALAPAAAAAIGHELGQLKQELTRIAGTTTFAGTPLLDGTYAGVFHVGAAAQETVQLVIGTSMGASGLGVAGLDPTRIGNPAVTATPAQDRVGLLRIGTAAFVGATLPGALATLTGTVELDGVVLDLGAAIASAGPGATNGQLVAALNTAASAAGITHRADVFLDDGDDLIFRGPAVTASSTPAQLAAGTPQASASTRTVVVDAATTDGPRAGLLTFAGRTADDLPRLGGTITVGDKTLELGAVTYTDTDGNGTISGGEALAQVNAAAVAAGVTDGSHGFAFSTPYSLSATSYSDSEAVLYFQGPLPNATATPAELLAVSPAFTPAPHPLDVLDRALRTVSSQRADLGAFQNRLEHTLTRLSVGIGNTMAAESRIRDADMAEEAMRLTRSRILTDAGAAMLAQANRSPEGLLALFR